MSGWRDFKTPGRPDNVDFVDYVDSPQVEEITLSTLSTKSMGEGFQTPLADSRNSGEPNRAAPAIKQWIPLTNKQCQALIKKYAANGDDRRLWLRFWTYIGKQVDEGASYEYVHASCENLERAWNDCTAQGAA